MCALPNCTLPYCAASNSQLLFLQTCSCLCLLLHKKSGMALHYGGLDQLCKPMACVESSIYDISTTALLGSKLEPGMSRFEETGLGSKWISPIWKQRNMQCAIWQYVHTCNSVLTDDHTIWSSLLTEMFTWC